MAADVEMHLLAACILTLYAVIITIAAEVVVHEHDALTGTSRGDSVLSVSHHRYCDNCSCLLSVFMYHYEYVHEASGLFKLITLKALCICKQNLFVDKLLL